MEKEHLEYKEVGFKYTTDSKTITPTELASFYEIPGIKEDMFIRDDTGKAMGFKGKIVPAAFLIVLAFSLMGEKGLAEGGIFLETTEKFSAPVYPNDTLRIEGELLGKRITSKGDRVVVKYSWNLINQNDLVVAHGENIELLPNPEKA
jgi:acyl dehydratase